MNKNLSDPEGGGRHSSQREIPEQGQRMLNSVECLGNKWHDIAGS